MNLRIAIDMMLMMFGVLFVGRDYHGVLTYIGFVLLNILVVRLHGMFETHARQAGQR